MANTVEIKLTLNDRLSKAYVRVSNAVKGQNKRIRDSFKRVEKQSGDTFKKMRSGALGVKAALAGLAGIATGAIVRSFIKAGSEVEDLTIQFETLLGSADAAQKRISELAKFAETTPFQLEQVAQASRLLEVLTEGALSSGDSLRMVGDAAAVAGTDFANLAMWVGRAYSGLQANRPIGEALMRLTELGVVTAKTRNQIEMLQQAGRGAEAWIVLRKELEKNSGGMEKLSKSVTGLTSTIRDQLNAAIRQMMDSGVWDKLREALAGIVKRMGDALNSGLFTKWGERLNFIVDNLDKLILAGKLFFTVFAINKIMLLINSFGGLVTKLTAINPVLAGLTAAAGAIVIALDRMEASVKNNARTLEEFTKTSADTERLKNFVVELDNLTKQMDVQRATVDSLRAGQSRWNEIFHGTNQNIIDAEKQLSRTTTKVQEMREQLEGMTSKSVVGSFTNLSDMIRVLDARLLTLRKNAAKPVKGEQQTGMKTPTIPGIPSPEKTKEIVGLGMAELRKGAQERLSLQLEIDEMLLTAQENSRQKDIELAQIALQRKTNVLLNAKAAENDFVKAAEELHRRELSEINQKWDEIEKQNMLNRIAVQKKSLNELTSNFAKLAQANKKFGALFKAAAISEAIISTYTSAQNMFKAGTQFPFPANLVMPWVLSGSAVAAGLANIATIKAQKFQSGGIVPGVGNTDSVPSLLTPGEVVLNREQQKNLLNGNAGRAIKIDNVQINVNGSISPEATANTIQERLKQLSDMNTELDALQVV